MNDTSFEWVPLQAIFSREDNPRKKFDESGLDELAESIRQHGVIQPLIVRKRAENLHAYDIIAGERRWRAARIAGEYQLPVLVRDLSDLEVAEYQLAENIDRNELTPLEESHGVCRLVELGRSVHDVADKLARSDEWVQLRLDLPTLPAPALECLESGKISLGGACQLLKLDEEEREEASQMMIQLDGVLTERSVSDLVQSRYLEPRRRQDAWDDLSARCEEKWPAGAAAISDVNVSHVYVRAWGEGVGHYVAAGDQIGGHAALPAEGVVSWGSLADVHGIASLMVPYGPEVNEDRVARLIDKREVIDAERALRESGGEFTIGPRKPKLEEAPEEDDEDEFDDCLQTAWQECRQSLPAGQFELFKAGFEAGAEMMSERGGAQE